MWIKFNVKPIMWLYIHLLPNDLAYPKVLQLEL